MPKLIPLEPAHTVIQLFGGYADTAKLLSRDETRIRRWTYPRERGGTGGIIPTKMQLRLLELAPSKGVALAPQDFFPKPDILVHSRSLGREVRKAQGTVPERAGRKVRAAS